MRLRTQAIIVLVGVGILFGLVIAGNLTEPDSPKIEASQHVEQDSVFEKRKTLVLSNLKQIQRDFRIEFDRDLTPRQDDDARFQTYKVIHNIDGHIGDMTFYYGYSSVSHPSKFDKIFQTSVFLSSESGVIPTGNSLNIHKDILYVLIPIWSFTNVGETSSEWIDNIIRNEPINENEEQSGIISLDSREIKFDYREKEFGYYRLLITDKME